MPSTLRVVCTALLLLAVPGTARAEFFAVPFAGVKFGGSTSIVDLELAAGKKKLALGVAGRWVNDGFLGYEVELGNIGGYFENENVSVGPLIRHGSYVTDLSGNLIFTLPPQFTGGGLRPYFVAGGGIIHAESSDALGVFQVRRTVPAITLGGGATGLFTPTVGVRFDIRQVRSLSKDAPFGLVGRRISYSRFTIGLLLRL